MEWFSYLAAVALGAAGWHVLSDAWQRYQFRRWLARHRAEGLDIQPVTLPANVRWTEGREYPDE